jgi:hypothetical protein
MGMKKFGNPSTGIYMAVESGELYVLSNKKMEARFDEVGRFYPSVATFQVAFSKGFIDKTAVYAAFKTRMVRIGNL